MIRIEIIANQSVQDELVNNIENLLPDMLYTILPLATGKGKNSYKNGDTTWPETNFVLIAYADESIEKKISQIVRFVKLKFSTEGIKLFIMHDKK
ncbi:MAG: hypothetical protein K6F69_06380 [Treponema sp.]|nr:hypothetical protein [Treponema sp.]